MRYRLISLHPINKLSGPANEFEKKGLKAITTEPDRPYKGFVTEGGERRFEALYADRAVSQVCVTCHNAHPQSSKRDYRLDDVLGAVSISIPVPGRAEDPLVKASPPRPFSSRLFGSSRADVAHTFG